MTSIAAAARSLGSELERTFDTQFRSIAPDLPRPVPHFRFDAKRRWEFDRAWPPYKVAVELEGGSFGKRVVCHNCGSVVRTMTAKGTVGAETRSAGWHGHYGRFLADREKYNAATVQGWMVLRFVNDDVISLPFEMVEVIRQALENRAYSVARVEALPPPQVRILHLVAAGFRTHEIAERLGLTTESVRSHSVRMCERLRATNRANAVARGLVWGLVDPMHIPWACDAADFLGITGSVSAFGAFNLTQG